MEHHFSAEPSILLVIFQSWATLGWCGQVQVVALECLPCIPAHMLGKALAGEELAKRIAQCFSNSSKEARTIYTHCRPCVHRAQQVNVAALCCQDCTAAHMLAKVLAGKIFARRPLRHLSSSPQHEHCYIAHHSRMYGPHKGSGGASSLLMGSLGLQPQKSITCGSARFT